MLFCMLWQILGRLPMCGAHLTVVAEEGVSPSCTKAGPCAPALPCSTCSRTDCYSASRYGILSGILGHSRELTACGLTPPSWHARFRVIEEAALSLPLLLPECACDAAHGFGVRR
jgi:hypothetical protein